MEDIGGRISCIRGERTMARWVGAGLVFALLVPAARARAAEEGPAVQAALQYLRAQAGSAQLGETALIALAMIKAEVPANDPALAACVDKIRRHFNASIYVPERSGGADVYEAAVVALALANINPESLKGEIAGAAQYIIAHQKANGSWDYNQRTAGDTSISQYAILGLWECENAGVDIPPNVWDKAASWYLSTQSQAGSWNYHRDESFNPETISMTAAGVGSLLICNRQLARHRKAFDSANPLLTPLVPQGASSSYEVSTSASRINEGVRRGIAWIGSNFQVSAQGIIGQSPYYGLYGIERIGALADREKIGGTNWFEQGRKYILGSQKSDGHWAAQHGDVPNTVWAILFITKSTAKSVRKFEIKRLGAGTLLGGRGLPKDLSGLTIAQGRVVVRPMNGAIDGMLDVLADPRSENADSALAGLVERYQTGGPKILRPHKDRFRKLLNDRDPGVRRVAAWALGRTADMDVVPALIAALRDPDENVVGEARTGLQVISRKIDGYGPVPGSTPEQRAEAAKKWKGWYDSVRPPDFEGPDDDLGAAPPP
jgi:hypothetical protein